LQAAAMDLLNPPAAAMLRRQGWLLAVEAGGNAAAIDRYARELSAMGAAYLGQIKGEQLWRAIQDFTPYFLGAHPRGAVARVSCTLKELGAVMGTIDGPAIARAGSGVAYAYFAEAERATAWVAATARVHAKAVIEFAPDDCRERLDLWPAPGHDLETIERIKRMFDPQNLLNRGRLYRRL